MWLFILLKLTAKFPLKHILILKKKKRKEGHFGQHRLCPAKIQDDHSWNAFDHRSAKLDLSPETEQQQLNVYIFCCLNHQLCFASLPDNKVHLQMLSYTK